MPGTGAGFSRCEMCSLISVMKTKGIRLGIFLGCRDTGQTRCNAAGGAKSEKKGK